MAGIAGPVGPAMLTYSLARAENPRNNGIAQYPDCTGQQLIDDDMFNQLQREELAAGLQRRIKQDSSLLDGLRADLRPLKTDVLEIKPRTAQAAAVISADSGSKRFAFDPYQIQVIRVVDSNNKTYSLDVISPTLEPAELLSTHISSTGEGISPLGRMMIRLEVKTLHELNSSIPEKINPERLSLGWVSMYRELLEWAALLELAERAWGGETILVFDGLLRTKKFNEGLFIKYRKLLEGALAQQKKKNGVDVYVVGLSQSNEVLSRYRLALEIEGIFAGKGASYLAIPRKLEEKTYVWKEWARGDDNWEKGEANKFVGGKLFFVKFGRGPHDLVWPVDIIQSQIDQHGKIMACLLNDTIDGFPLGHYPRSLQRATENAAIEDFELDLVQHEMLKQIRESLGSEAHHLDTIRLKNGN